MAPIPTVAKIPAAIGAPQHVILPKTAKSAAPNPVKVDFLFVISILYNFKVYRDVGKGWEKMQDS
ncbi:hypothetical protein ELS83_12985 [Marinifilum sp. JC070]|uniref:Uncharacterized protein n=1 Tax=Marinifilum caeruleilacunae TaxID=2499076 RepID=A0ABX1WX89_9BACT|nr:hypothetical protein [Marinifilum caeruleilacunae]